MTPLRTMPEQRSLLSPQPLHVSIYPGEGGRERGELSTLPRKFAFKFFLFI